MSFSKTCPKSYRSSLRGFLSSLLVLTTLTGTAWAADHVPAGSVLLVPLDGEAAARLGVEDVGDPGTLRIRALVGTSWGILLIADDYGLLDRDELAEVYAIAMDDKACRAALEDCTSPVQSPGAGTKSRLTLWAGIMLGVFAAGVVAGVVVDAPE